MKLIIKSFLGAASLAKHVYKSFKLQDLNISKVLKKKGAGYILTYIDCFQTLPFKAASKEFFC